MPRDMPRQAADVVDRFQERFGVAPTVVVRAPGRVNVIGEHADYSNLPVMPTAIQRSLTIAASPARDGRITAHSTMFGDARISPAGVPDDDSDVGGWSRYLAAAAAEMTESGGGDLLVAGDLPPESGLSSSAALITGVLAALAAVAGRELDQPELVRRAIAAE